MYMHSAQVHIQAHKRAHTHARTHICMHIHTNMHACTHTRAHAHTHARTHACAHAHAHSFTLTVLFHTHGTFCRSPTSSTAAWTTATPQVAGPPAGWVYACVDATGGLGLVFTVFIGQPGYWTARVHLSRAQTIVHENSQLEWLASP